MKIGILTLPLHTNYGGILQAYALQTVLERMGHEVFVIDQDRDIHRSALRQSLTLGKYGVNRFLLRKDVEYYNPQKKNRERLEREQYTREFIDKYIHIFQVKNLIKDFPKDVDAIIVGSDQVWRSQYFTMFYNCGIEHAFLNFAQKWTIKRIAYAASFGTDDWEYSEDETLKCAQLLKNFDAVSVRETSGVKLCKEKLGYGNAQHVLDPTLLLEKEDYIHLVEKAKIPQISGNLMCYVLDNTEEIQQLIDRIAKEKHLTPFYANSKVEDEKASQHERIQPPVEQWLRGFMDAEFVVTDSFHACVFSIIFEKPFVVLGNPTRGVARYESLLSDFKLMGNLISSVREYQVQKSYAIMPNDTASTLANKRSFSMNFMKKTIER